MKEVMAWLLFLSMGAWLVLMSSGCAKKGVIRQQIPDLVDVEKQIEGFSKESAAANKMTLEEITDFLNRVKAVHDTFPGQLVTLSVDVQRELQRIFQEAKKAWRDVNMKVEEAPEPVTVK